MPVEYVILKDSPQPREVCPACGDYPFEAVDRGLYQREKHDARGKRQNYCLVICSECESAVGYEAPPWNSKAWKQKNVSDLIREQNRLAKQLTCWVVSAGITVLVGLLLLCATL